MKVLAITVLSIITYLLVGVAFSVAIHILHLRHPEVNDFDEDWEELLIVLWPLYLLIFLMMLPAWFVSHLYETLVAVVDKSLEEESDDTRGND